MSEFDEQRLYAIEQMYGSSGPGTLGETTARMGREITALRGLVRRLRDGMRTWAADEDGVHEGAWGAYADACEALGEPRPCIECGKPESAPNPECFGTPHAQDDGR